MFVTTLLCVLIYICVQVWLKRHYSYWKNRGFPYLEPQSIVGHLPGFFFQKQYIGDAYKEIYDRAVGLKILGIFHAFKPMLLVRDPDVAKEILTKSFMNFTDRDIELDKNLEITAYNLFFNQDTQLWKSTRNHLSKLFTASKMKSCMQEIKRSNGKLHRCLERKFKEVVDMKELISDFTADFAFSCFFGLDTPLLDEDEKTGEQLREFGKLFFKPSATTMLHGFLSCLPGRLSMLCKVPILPKKATNLFLSITEEIHEHRRTSGFSRPDFFEHMITYSKLNDEQIKQKSEEKMNLAGQCSAFYAAGFETSSFTISSCLHALAHHPDMQQRVAEEVASLQGDFTYESLKNLKYLDMVIKETLRLFPPVPDLMRKCTSTYTSADGYTIEKGTRVVVPIHAIHRDPSYFPNPLEFKPERWINPMHHKYAYLPFGDGPRSCIGMRLGLQQVKLCLAGIIEKYEVYPDSRSPYPPNYSPAIFVTAYNKNGFWMKLQPRFELGS